MGSVKKIPRKMPPCGDGDKNREKPVANPDPIIYNMRKPMRKRNRMDSMKRVREGASRMVKRAGMGFRGRGGTAVPGDARPGVMGMRGMLRHPIGVAPQ